MKRLTLMSCATAMALCLVGNPQTGLAQQQEDQEQQEQSVQSDEERERDEQTRQEERQRQQREQERQREQQRQQQEQQRERQRQQQDQQRQQPDQQQRESQFDQQFQRDQRFEQDQRFQDDQQRFQEDQRFGQDQGFQQDQRFQGRTQQQLELGAQLQDYGDRLVISNVRDQSLAAQVGLQPQDVIVSIDGRTVRTQDQFRQQLVTLQRQGGRIPLVIVRDGERQTVYLDLDRYGRDDRRFPRDRDSYGGGQAWLGVILDPRYEDYAVVQRVYPDSAADQAGIRQGDWIVGVNNRRIQSPAHLSQMIDNMRPGEQVEIQVARRVTRSLDARLGQMGDRDQGRFARQPQNRFDQRFQSQQFQTEDEFRSGYRGVDEQDVFQEEGFQQGQQGRRDQDRGLRDRFNPNEERGLRDRLDRDQDRDRLFNNRDQ